MSKQTKKEQREAKRAAREAREARKIINYIIWGLALLFVVGFILAVTFFT